MNAQDNLGNTALMSAAAIGSTDSVDTLLAAGANASAKDNSGRTALILARRSDIITALQRKMMQEDYDAARLDGTAAVLKAFLTKWPESSFAAERRGCCISAKSKTIMQPPSLMARQPCSKGF